MRLIIQIQRRQRKCLYPRPLRRIRAREANLLAEEREDGWCLADDERLAVLAFAVDAERGGCKGGGVAVGVVGCVVGFEREDVLDAVFGGVADVCVGGLGGFEGEADEFAAAGWGV